MSITEAVNQDVTDKSVSVDIKKKNNPLGKLAHNKSKALQVYNQQVKKLDVDPQDK